MTHFRGEILLPPTNGGWQRLPSRKRNGAKIELFRVRGRNAQLLLREARNLGGDSSDGSVRRWLGSIEGG